MLATGQRSIEVLGAKRDEIDADGWWTIPAGRIKNKTEHRVWLNETARRVLDQSNRVRASWSQTYPLICG